MSDVIKAVLSNPQRPEFGQITIPFPIPADQYDQTIGMLRAMGLGSAVDRNCRVADIDSYYRWPLGVVFHWPPYTTIRFYSFFLDIIPLDSPRFFIMEVYRLVME